MWVVTWGKRGAQRTIRRGMYVYLAELPPELETWDGEQETDEGQLAWQSLAWITDHRNTEIVSNVTYCLPHMLTATAPHMYYCDYGYAMTRLTRVTIQPTDILD